MEQIVPWMLGPAGIVLGWWLNERSIRGRASQAERRAAETEERERVLAAVRLARQVASGARDLLHAMYLKGVHRSAPAGLTEMMDEYNSTRDQFKDSLLALRVLGPSWAVEAAQRVDLLASRLTELAFVMQKNLTSEQVKATNTEIPQLDALVIDFVEEVSRRYKCASSGTSPATGLRGRRALATARRVMPVRGGRTSEPGDGDWFHQR